MKRSRNQIGISILFLCFSWTGVASASSWIQGTAVSSAGSEEMVGHLGNGDSLSNAIEYFIPLDDDNSNGGIYGHTTGFNCYDGGTAEAGTCRDSGNGNQAAYTDADALKMNIFFDTDGAEFSSAELRFRFDDLDLVGDNDPTGFFESISLAYFDTAFNLNPVGDPIIQADLGINLPYVWSPNLILWSLGGIDLNILNASSQDNGGFWIQLGFGAKFHTNGVNTAELLAADLKVSAVPVPAAFWLFGTALIGFIGVSRRSRI